MGQSKRLMSLLVVLLVISVKVDSSQDVMKALTKKFLKAYEVCAKEFNIKEGTAGQMIGFWREDFTSSSRDVGCAIYCLSTKLDLLETDGSIHHANTAEFAKQHGAGEDTAKKLVDILHKCQQTTPANEDKCLNALDVAMCFKKEIHNLDWAPDPELLFEEIIAEMSG